MRIPRTCAPRRIGQLLGVLEGFSRNYRFIKTLRQSAFAAAPPGFLHAKICKAEDIVTTRIFYHELSPVTSAMHMRQAKRLFEAQGIEIVPAPCNFTYLIHPDDSFRMPWPSSEGLGLWGMVMHEVVGMVMVGY